MPETDRQRSDLIGEHPTADAGQLLQAVLFMSTWTLDTFLLEYTTFLNYYVPEGVRTPLGIVVLIIAGYVSGSGLHMVFGQKREKPRVIDTGVYSIVRHPIYLGEILLYIGFLCLGTSLAAALIVLFAAMFLHHISRYEERLLLAHFGEAYESYTRQVPMWIPRLRRG